MTAPVADRQTGWMPDASTFGARLALLRQHMRWGNVKEAAVACGLPVETWRSWERDGREPHRITTIAKQISTATGCDFLWLLVGPDGVNGGGGGNTGQYLSDERQYFAPARLVATAGESTDHPSGRRPVRRTRPRAASSRPVTAVAA